MTSSNDVVDNEFDSECGRVIVCWGRREPIEDYISRSSDKLFVESVKELLHVVQCRFVQDNMPADTVEDDKDVDGVDIEDVDQLLDGLARNVSGATGGCAMDINWWVAFSYTLYEAGSLIDQFDAWPEESVVGNFWGDPEELEQTCLTVRERYREKERANMLLGITAGDFVKITQATSRFAPINHELFNRAIDSRSKEAFFSAIGIPYCLASPRFE